MCADILGIKLTFTHSEKVYITGLYFILSDNDRITVNESLSKEVRTFYRKQLTYSDNVTTILL